MSVSYLFNKNVVLHFFSPQIPFSCIHWKKNDTFQPNQTKNVLWVYFSLPYLANSLNNCECSFLFLPLFMEQVWTV